MTLATAPVDAAPPAAEAPLTVHVEGGYALHTEPPAAAPGAPDAGPPRTATVAATHRLELRCGSARIVLTPGKIVIDAPEVQVLGDVARIHC